VTVGTIEQEVFGAKWIVNGFPKSGTHLLVQLISPLAPYQPPTECGYFKQPWSGTFLDNSWTNRWAPLEQTTFKIGRVHNGHMIKSHLGYMPELERWMYLAGVVHVFIYRDLRDVAVSQAYHIINSTDAHLVHPGGDEYRALGGFDEILAAVIAGHGRFPGLIYRWQHYAGWLNVPWVLAVRFEDVRNDPKVWAERVFRHAMERSAGTWMRRVSFDPSGLDALTSVMARASEQREKSPTFRAGRVGDWRDEFTPEHIALWKEHDGEKWLERLGYERHGWYGPERPPDARSGISQVAGAALHQGVAAGEAGGE